MKKKPSQKRRAFKTVRTDGCILECLAHLHHHPENCSPLWTELLLAEAVARGLSYAPPAPDQAEEGAVDPQLVTI